jgi:MSHA biogenesis protein MshI
MEGEEPLAFFPRRMSSTPGVSGISLGSEGIALAHLVRPKQGPPVLKACDFIPHSDDREPTRALQEGLRQHGLSRGRCVGVMELGRYHLLQVEPPEVPEAEMKDALRWQIKDLIDFPLDQAVIDFFQVPSQVHRGRARVAYVVAARKALVREGVELLRGAKMRIAAVDVTELAIRNIVSLLPEDPAGVAFLFLDSTTGLITVTRNSMLFLARGITLGTNELRRFSGRKKGDDPTDLDTELRDLLDSIVLELQRSLDFYESNFSQSPIGSLVVAPTDPEIPELFPYLRSYLGPRVRMLDLGSLVEAPDLPPGLQARCLTAIGGALRLE